MLTLSLSRSSRAVLLGSALVLAVVVGAPAAVGAQEVALADVPLVAAPAIPSWDESSGYGSVEASRAAIAYSSGSGTLTSQVPSDARWAPARAIAPAPARSASFLLTAQRALQAADPGSMPAAALAAIVSDGLAWDATSGYGSVEASRAAIASGERAESAHLATSTLPANGDDRIANVQFGADSPGVYCVSSTAHAIRPALLSRCVP